MPAESQPSTRDAVTWPFELAEISNLPGYEVGVQMIERPPGGAAVPHYHPDGHEWVYCAAGSMMLTIGDRPAKELKAGEVEYLPANVVHFGRNVSAAPVKLILFRVKPAGQPLMVRI